jgi:hypothetical protein
MSGDSRHYCRICHFAISRELSDSCSNSGEISGMADPQLSVRSAKARDLARRERRSIADVVERALEAYEIREAEREPASTFYARLASEYGCDLDLEVIIVKTGKSTRDRSFDLPRYEGRLGDTARGAELCRNRLTHAERRGARAADRNGRVPFLRKINFAAISAREGVGA